MRLPKGGHRRRQAARRRHLSGEADPAAGSRPEAVGTTETLERWVEFARAAEVKGREVVSIVPQAEVKMVVKDPPPASGGSKVQTLKGNDYVRVWFNNGGNHYLIHLPSRRRAPAN